MNNLLISIINSYSKVSDERIKTFMKSYRSTKDKFISFPLNRDTTDKIILLFTINPIKDSKWKIFRKLKPNDKVGFISKEMISLASKLKVSQLAIDNYITAKKDWDFSKKYYKVDYKDENIKKKVEDAVKTLHDEYNLRPLKMIISDEHNHTTCYNKLYSETNKFIDFIFEKSINKLSKEIEEERSIDIN